MLGYPLSEVGFLLSLTGRWLVASQTTGRFGENYHYSVGSLCLYWVSATTALAVGVREREEKKRERKRERETIPIRMRVNAMTLR